MYNCDQGQHFRILAGFGKKYAKKILATPMLYNAFFNYLFFLMAPNFLALATTLENLGARWLLAKKVNFVPCTVFLELHTCMYALRKLFISQNR